MSLSATIIFLEQRDTRINSLVGWQNIDNLHWVRASSGTSDQVELRYSCYSWWLPPPRWPGGNGRSLSGFLVIVVGSDPSIVRGSCAHPCGTSCRVTLVESWLDGVHFLSGSLWRPSGGLGMYGQLAREPSSWDLPQWGRWLPASNRTSGIYLVFTCPMQFALYSLVH